MDSGQGIKDLHASCGCERCIGSSPGKDEDTIACNCETRAASGGNGPCSCSGAGSPGGQGIPGQDPGVYPRTRVIPVTYHLHGRDRRAHILARLGYNRSGYRVEPGLYSVGHPDEHSPVIVTANYTLSFDAVRSSLEGHDAYILVLDTRGINVWCAAGKGTFGTAELVNRIRETGFSSIVHHRRVILPQLGAPGVSAHEVHKACGFHVEYGPVRAADLPAFLRDRVATPAMRRVTFGLWDRIVLVPVELKGVILPAIVAALALWFLGGWLPAAAVIVAVLAGTVLFPVLLPFIPTTDFSTRGAILGVLVSLPFAAIAWVMFPGPMGILAAASLLLVMTAVTAYLALNFTGSTPFTSRSGVKKEIFRYIPVIAGSAIIGLCCAIAVGAGILAGWW